MEWPQVAGTAGTLVLMVYFIVAYVCTTLGDWHFNRKLEKDHPEYKQRRLDREYNRKQGN